MISKGAVASSVSVIAGLPPLSGSMTIMNLGFAPNVTFPRSPTLWLISFPSIIAEATTRTLLQSAVAEAVVDAWSDPLTKSWPPSMIKGEDAK